MQLQPTDVKPTGARLRSPLRGWPTFGMFGVVGLFAGTFACIVPDTGIFIESQLLNPTPVRILSRPPLHPQMVALCNLSSADPLAERRISARFSEILRFCPETPSDRHRGLLRHRDGPFCVCPGATGIDTRALPMFDLYAEDAGAEGDDTLYGVLMLDADLRSSTPGAFVAYDNFFPRCSEGERLGRDGLWPDEAPDDPRQRYADFAQNPNDPDAPIREPDRGAPTSARDTPPLWRFSIGASDRLDWCNNNNHRKVSPGLHSVQFLVTDRPFFRPVRLDSRQGHEQCGVPDVAEGATFAVTHWVFQCLDGSDPANDCACGVAPS